MTKKEILAKVDHTLLKPEATWNDVKVLCDEAAENQTASICINPVFVERAVKYLDGKVPVCTVIGFPLGANTTEIKVAELNKALADGATEFDMVINIGELKAGNLDYVTNEIKELKAQIPNNVLKVIVETCLLTQQEKIDVCKACIDGGADFIKTSTGFSTGGATYEDVELFAKEIQGKIKIKASGGIRTVEDMITFIGLGADRLGSSSAIKLLEDYKG